MKSIYQAIAIMAILYLAISFVYVDLNCFNWTSDTRIGFILVSSIVWTLTVATAFSVKKIKRE